MLLKGSSFKRFFHFNKVISHRQTLHCKIVINVGLSAGLEEIILLFCNYQHWESGEKKAWLNVIKTEPWGFLCPAQKVSVRKQKTGGTNEPAQFIITSHTNSVNDDRTLSNISVLVGVTSHLITSPLNCCHWKSTDAITALIDLWRLRWGVCAPMKNQAFSLCSLLVCFFLRLEVSSPSQSIRL